MSALAKAVAESREEWKEACAETDSLHFVVDIYPTTDDGVYAEAAEAECRAARAHIQNLEALIATLLDSSK